MVQWQKATIQFWWNTIARSAPPWCCPPVDKGKSLACSIPLHLSGLGLTSLSQPVLLPEEHGLSLAVLHSYDPQPLPVDQSCCVPFITVWNGPGLASFFWPQFGLSLLCHRRPLLYNAPNLPALISICYYNSRLNQLYEMCHFFAFPFQCCIYANAFSSSTNGVEGIDDSELWKIEQNYAFIKMNGTWIDHINVFQNMGHFQMVHDKC